MTDPFAAPDPAAPTRKLGHEIVLWGGLGLCLLIATVTVLLPELSGAETPKSAAPAPR